MALGIGKKSCELLGITEEDVKLIEYLAPKDYWDWQGLRDEFQEKFPQTDGYLMQCHHMPNKPDIIMEMFNELLGGFGVEAIRSERKWLNSYYGDCFATYVNMGDTYDITILRNNKNGKFMVTSWGNFVEHNNI